MSTDDTERARRTYEAYAASAGVETPFRMLPARLQRAWVAADRAARSEPAAHPVAPGTASGALRCG